MIPFVLLGYLRLLIAAWTWVHLPQQQHSSSYKNQFIVVSVISLLISCFSAFFIGGIFLHLSNSLHNAMLQRVARAPMRFFNSNPLGRIINRFSKDTALADSVVIPQIQTWFQVSTISILELLLGLSPHILESTSLPFSSAWSGGCLLVDCSHTPFRNAHLSQCALT